MSIETITDIADFIAPYGKEIKLQRVELENSDFELFRIRIKEGKRFTMLDLDEASVNILMNQMTAWRNEVDG